MHNNQNRQPATRELAAGRPAAGPSAPADGKIRELLWELLRNRSTYGLRFHRNEKIGNYQVDFCCHSEKIVVEISDFPFENFKEMDRTMERHLHLIDEGYTVLGFDGKTIRNNPGYIREMIKTHVQINHAGGMDSFSIDFGT